MGFSMATDLSAGGALLGTLFSVALASGGAYVASAGKQGIVLARMVLLVLVPLVVIGILLVVSALHFVPVDDTASGSKLTPALLAGIAVSLGWIAGPLTQELRRSDEQEERRRDMIEACANEVWLIAKFAANLNIEVVIQQMQRSFARDNSYRVFVLYQREFGTLRRLVEQIEILRKDQIDPVMSFFQLMSRLDQIEGKLNSEQFCTLPRPRRENAVVMYYRILETVPADSLRVLEALDRPEYAAKLKTHIDQKKTEFTPSAETRGADK